MLNKKTIPKLLLYITFYASFIYWFFIFKTIDPGEGWSSLCEITFYNLSNKDTVSLDKMYYLLYTEFELRFSITSLILLILVIIHTYLIFRKLVKKNQSRFMEITLHGILWGIIILQIEFACMTFLRGQYDFMVAYLLSLFCTITLVLLTKRDKIEGKVA